MNTHPTPTDFFVPPPCTFAFFFWSHDSPVRISASMGFVGLDIFFLRFRSEVYPQPGFSTKLPHEVSPFFFTNASFFPPPPPTKFPSGFSFQVSRTHPFLISIFFPSNRSSFPRFPSFGSSDYPRCPPNFVRCHLLYFPLSGFFFDPSKRHLWRTPFCLNAYEPL